MFLVSPQSEFCTPGTNTRSNLLPVEEGDTFHHLWHLLQKKILPFVCSFYHLDTYSECSMLPSALLAQG